MREKLNRIDKTSKGTKYLRLSRNIKSSHLKLNSKRFGNRHRLTVPSAQKFAVRKQIQAQFPNSVVNLLSVNPIYQGNVTACSFVSFINLCQMTNNMHLISDSNITQTWKKYWKSWKLSNGCDDIAAALDLMTKQGLLVDHSHSQIEYIPIKSAKHSENNYNTRFWNPSAAIDRLQRQLQSEIGESVLYNEAKERYETMPQVYEICNLIESLLDRMIPIQMNAMEHSRVCVGYNTNSLVFVDTWGDDMQIPGEYYAGLSVVNKWQFYSQIRDLSYLKNTSKTVIVID